MHMLSYVRAERLAVACLLNCSKPATAVWTGSSGAAFMQRLVGPNMPAKYHTAGHAHTLFMYVKCCGDCA